MQPFKSQDGSFLRRKLCSGNPSEESEGEIFFFKKKKKKKAAVRGGTFTRPAPPTINPPLRPKCMIHLINLTMRFDQM